MRLKTLAIATLAASGIAAAAATTPAPTTRHFDLLIRNGEIIDGTGAPRYRADIAINGDEIVAIGQLREATAARTVDAKDRVVTPGFIDVHAHVADEEYGETGLLSNDVKRRAAQNYVAQGVTTTVTNPDGSQSMPLRELREKLTRKGFGPNVVLMNGHSGMRELVMKGDVRRAATAEEIRQMQDILAHDLAEENSFGMSLGIEYEPARDASLEEQLALGRVLANYNGIFIPHLRSQGIAPMWYKPSQDKGRKPPTLDDSIDETLKVAEATGATVVFTHMKAWGPGYRGNAGRVIKRLQDARDRGLNVYMDVYPYDSSGSDGSFVAVPSWAFGKREDAGFNYRKALDATLKGADSAKKSDFAADVRHQLDLKGGPENVRVLAYPNQKYVGKTYAELMKLRGLDEAGLAIALQREGDPKYPGGARMRSFSMAEQDIESFYRLDWCSVSTDGWIVLPEEAVGDKKYVETNRRLFGSYPRRLAYYSAERKVDSLEHAVRAASGLPAQILSITDRGRIAVGLKADIAVLDMANLRDNTTYLEPSVYPSGVDYVLVNGKFAVDGGKRTLALAGKILTPSGRATASAD
jgi:N-acyl-D-amino-acid deacylase